MRTQHWREKISGGLAALAIAAAQGHCAEAPEIRKPAPAARPGLRIMDAVRLTLKSQPMIRLQERQVDFARGAARAAGGTFDWQFESSFQNSSDDQPLPDGLPAPLDKDSLESQTRELRMGFTRKFRSGISLNSSVYGTQLDATNYDAGDATRYGVDFSIVFPLLKGRGRVSAAQEDAAKKNLQATALDLKHEISTTIYTTVLSYWNYLAAQDQLEIFRESERASSKLAGELEKLVKADERPQSDLTQMEANVAERTAQRIASEQSLQEARLELGTAMGIPGRQVSALPAAQDQFPSLLDLNTTPKQDDRLIDLALERRADLLSSRRQEKTNELLLAEAENACKPSLDFFVGANRSTLDNDSGDGAFSPVNSDYVDFAQDDETHGYLGFRFSTPLGNNTARGTLAQQSARHGQALIRTQDLERVIVSRVHVALAVLRLSIAQTIETDRSVQRYRKSVEDEKKKFKMGMATILDVISIEDRLRQARISNVTGRLRYAHALAALRYETGTILRGRDVRIESITIREITTYPNWSANKGK